MTRFAPILSVLPPAQRAVWSSLGPARERGFVLYGGTAVALRLGHRSSVDFDFFSDRSFVPSALLAELPFLAGARVLESAPDTLTVQIVPDAGSDYVKLSFFGGLSFGRVGEPALSEDNLVLAASLLDLMATKLKVLHDRISAKDYIDLAALIANGLSLPEGLAAGRCLFGERFEPGITLKAMTYFEGGDLETLSVADREILAAAAAAVHGPLPQLALRSRSLS